MRDLATETLLIVCLLGAAFLALRGSGAPEERGARATAPDTTGDGRIEILPERQVRAAARAMTGESARPEEQRMIAHVIQNRVESGRHPDTPFKVVHEPGEFAPMLGDVPRADPPARQVARDVLTLPGADPTGGATHFYSPRSMEPAFSEPYWADALTETEVPAIDTTRFRFFRPNR